MKPWQKASSGTTFHVYIWTVLFDIVSCYLWFLQCEKHNANDDADNDNDDDNDDDDANGDEANG